MLDLKSSLNALEDRHRAALNWFHNHRGEEQGWPEPLPDGTLLVTKPKGIYKPKWTRYALSVRQSLTGEYPDRDPEVREDGTWSYEYFQENPDPGQRDSHFTNLGLVDCMKDDVPIGVFRQVSTKPSSRYQVLGLAAVVDWQDGYFFLEGYSPTGSAYDRKAEAEIATLTAKHEADAASDNGPNTVEFPDERERAVGNIVRRRGQPEFRKQLIKAYGGRCAISGCDAEAALEAAHIVPYKGPKSNSLFNGILLRADLHTLFDLGLLAVDTANMTVILAPEIKGTAYGDLLGTAVSVPVGASTNLTIDALDAQREWSGLKRGGKQP